MNLQKKKKKNITNNNIISIPKNSNKFLNNKSSNNKLSYSMFIDDHKKPIINENLNYKKIKYVEPKTICTWVDDNSVTRCYQCGNSFSLFLRKHHCRNCGRIFCYDCCNFWENSEDLKLPQQSVLSWNEKQKVCENCYQKIQKYKNLKNLIKIFNLSNFNIHDYHIISQVCRKWNAVAMYYFSNFREIQYKLLDEPLNNDERNILWNNRHFFSKHSKWIIILLKAFNNEVDKIDKIIKIMDKSKNTSCWNLMCSRSCNCNLSIEDIVICLSYNLPLQIKNKLIHLLQNISNSELNCYLMLFLNYLSFSKNIYKDNLAKFLIKRSHKSIEISHMLYWNLNHILECNQHYNLFFEFKQMLLNENPFKKDLLEQQKFVNIIINTMSKFEHHKILKILENYFQNCPNIQAITNPSLKLHKILVSKIKIKNSSSKPILIPCEVSSKKHKKLYYEILYKNDDLRKEKIIMDIINLMDKILKKELSLDLHITRYRIIPVNNTQGFIEIISNSHTLYTIKRKGFTIQNYILENNTQRSLQEIRERFTKSCAAYCIISYLLGIGDRHLENIMITKTGLLFHIDYGFILGYEPKFIAPEIRITPEMVDALGGIESTYYKKFQALCTQAYNCLRRHANLFLVMLSLLYKIKPSIDNGKFTEEYIKSQILKRFIPNDNYQDAKLKFITKVNNSYKSNYNFNIIDFFHKGKEDTSIVEDSDSSYGSQIMNYLFTSE